jgi:hypothetical protein
MENTKLQKKIIKLQKEKINNLKKKIKNSSTNLIDFVKTKAIIKTKCSYT